MLRNKTKNLILLVITILTHYNCSNTPKHCDIDNLTANKLLGIWTHDTNENATFEIRKDSIYYPDHNGTYKYNLVDDSIKIKFDDFVSVGKIHFVGDTLVIQHTTGTDTFWHFKN